MELTYLRSGPGIVRSFLACSFSQTKDLELSFFPGDHRIGDVDSRLLFKIGYCLPDCALKNSQEPQDEHQQLNQVSLDTDPTPKFSLNFQLFLSNDWSENLVLHRACLLDDNILISHLSPPITFKTK